MAVTAYTGQPGMGKSYALVSQVMLEAVMEGRRVLTNIEGVVPQKVEDYCAAKLEKQKKDSAQVGTVVLFHGEDALKEEFWPAGGDDCSNSIVQPGDLIIFDEWKLYFSNRAKLPENMGAFLRMHRHLVDAKGQSTDLAVGTQLITDFHRDYRGLLERSYKYKKLSAVGLKKGYSWFAFEGHLQPKNGHYAQGTNIYRKEIFDLYSSYKGGKGIEAKTDKRSTIFGKGTIALACLVVVMIGGGSYFTYRFFTGAGMVKSASAVPVSVGAGGVASNPASPQRTPSSVGRISGFYTGSTGIRIVVVLPDGAVRVVGPDGFTFDGDRPIEGTIDGKRVVASDTLEEAFSGNSGFLSDAFGPSGG